METKQPTTENRKLKSTQVKTIMIIVGGIADKADTQSGERTPLMIADTPALDALAKCGCCGSVLTVPDDAEVSTQAAVLSLLGYDFQRGVPSADALEDFGRGHDAGERELRYFVVPKFSGHGALVTNSDLVRGIGRMALLRPYIPVDEMGRLGEFPLSRMAEIAVEGIEYYDFILVYVSAPHDCALRGDGDGKIEVIEEIDKELIRPIADYVWNAKMQMNLVVTGDHITSWRTKSVERGEVPAVVYFNDDLPYDTNSFNEESVADGPLNAPLPGDLIRKLVTFEPISDEGKA